MIYRRLGRTERQVSLLGIGGGYVMLLDLEAGTRVYERAVELGVNYFDGRYGFSSTMQRPVIRHNRERFVIATKTASATREQALRRIEEDCRELDTEYLDIFYLRTYNQEMVDAHFAPGGSIEGLLEAREQGRIGALGLAGHSDLTALARAVETGLIDVVEFPLNIVRRDAFDVLIPACRKHDVGMVIMKPMNVGLAPPEVCLPWLAAQPIHVMAPGISTLEQLEVDAAVLDRPQMALSPSEEAAVEHWRQAVNLETCRICDRVCQATCEQGLSIDWLIYHNVFQNELRRLGVDGFMNYPFAPWVKKNAEFMFSNTVATLEGCTHCGRCEQACPYGLPIMELLDHIREEESALVRELDKADWVSKYQDAVSPFPEQALAAWISGGKPRRR